MRADRIRIGQSAAADARDAARELHAAIAQPDIDLVLFFCSSEYDLDAIGAELDRLFVDVQVIGCTTAGEIGPLGCRDRSLTGASFPRGAFTSVSGRIGGLRRFDGAGTHQFVQELMQRLERSGGRPIETGRMFAFLMIDGLSMREEPVASALQKALGSVPLVGGSAGDGLSFNTTRVFFDGAFHTDSAVLLLMTTDAPFRAFKTQHFVPTDTRAVVSLADAEHRVVNEIDGWPAAEQYARLTGAPTDALDAMRFAASPVVVMLDGTNYVRAIQRANPDGSLTFFCAIEDGVVLRVARGVDFVKNIERQFAELRSAIGAPQIVIGCDCILRKLEMRARSLTADVERVFAGNRVVGFNGYGEQYRGIHVNQTLTGIAIGEPADV